MSVRTDFIKVLVSEDFIKDEDYAAEVVDELIAGNGSEEKWFSNGVAEFKLIKGFGGNYEYRNFRGIVGNKSLEAVEKALAL